MEQKNRFGDPGSPTSRVTLDKSPTLSEPQITKLQDGGGRLFRMVMRLHKARL